MRQKPKVLVIVVVVVIFTVSVLQTAFHDFFHNMFIITIKYTLAGRSRHLLKPSRGDLNHHIGKACLWYVDLSHVSFHKVPLPELHEHNQHLIIHFII